MAVEERKLASADLRLGMYVCRLDRPWDGTPFPLQGFLIQDETQLALIRELCREVSIDVEQSRTAQAALPHRRPPSSSAMTVQLDRVRDRVQYVDRCPLAEEIPRARDAQEHLTAFASQVIDDVRAGHKLPAEMVEQAVTPVVKSVLRSADAVFWLNNLRKRSDYEYSHALNCTALAAAFGRHLGLTEDLVVKLASGGLLLDIGKTQMPPDLLSFPGRLDTDQMAYIQRHVEFSLAILAEGGNRQPEVEEMVAHHHERIDGSGYPNGLHGAAIPLFGRIAAIVDSFDAMTSARSYRPGMARHEALQQLYRERDRLFQSELVEQFIQCIGVYPTGSLVELSTGEVAIVMAQNRTRQLCPRVMVLTTPDKQLDPDFRELDLLAEPPPGVHRVRIVQTLAPGAYGLDPTELYL